FTHFQPAFQASFLDLLRCARTITSTFFGFEILLYMYSFIEYKKKVKFLDYLGISYTTLLVLITIIISIDYYCSHDFEKMYWPVLTLFIGVVFAFLERFDYLIVMEWMMVSVTTMIILMWATTYGMKRLFAIPQKTTLYIAAILLVI